MTRSWHIHVRQAGSQSGWNLNNTSSRNKPLEVNIPFKIENRNNFTSTLRMSEQFGIKHIHTVYMWSLLVSAFVYICILPQTQQVNVLQTKWGAYSLLCATLSVVMTTRWAAFSSKAQPSDRWFHLFRIQAEWTADGAVVLGGLKVCVVTSLAPNHKRSTLTI